MAESIRGNKTLSGTWGELWIDGEKIFEFSKIELKVTANREDVQIGIDVDSKITGCCSSQIVSPVVVNLKPTAAAISPE